MTRVGWFGSASAIELTSQAGLVPTLRSLIERPLPGAPAPEAQRGLGYDDGTRPEAGV
jgi:hypothetical protein